MSTRDRDEGAPLVSQRRLPVAVTAGAVTGLVSGVTLGSIVGPLGMFFGLCLGLAVGAIAGKVIDKEDRRQASRHRELDAIIGVTEGSLGAGDVPRTPAPESDGDAEERERWLAEWLTPPPPSVTA